MQIQLFTIPVLGGEDLLIEMNKFLRGHKILQTEKHLIQDGQNAFWSFCITYIESAKAQDKTAVAEPVDYKALLDEASFKRFVKLRDIRKRVAQAEGVPAYAVFTNEELSELAKIETLTLANMRTVNGIGEKKVEKYGKYFVGTDADTTSTDLFTTNS
jgi:superfamily II DNA helicase RecQ